MSSAADRGAGDRAGAEAKQALADIDRDTRAKLLATIARRFGDLELAEDAVQDAFVQAMRSWPDDGVPTSPAAWLTTAAKRKALDSVRRGRLLERKLPRLRTQQQAEPVVDTFVDPAQTIADDPDEQNVNDDRLGLFFACAHPVLRPEDRVALTLRFLGGLTTAEVAYALLVPITTMQQRLVRAKKRIRAHGVRFEPPRREQLPHRLHDVQRVIYLLFCEGFSRSSGQTHTREDLTDEAIRLATVLHTLLPGSAETAGLRALLVLTHARRHARTDSAGQPIPLAEQDRSLWSQPQINAGVALTEQAAAAPGAGPYAIQAAIAAVHAESPSFDQTDWAQIAVLYKMLAAFEPTPVVRLGHAVAIGRARGLRAGLQRLDALADDDVLAQYRPFHIARAVTLTELGDHKGAAAAYRRALALAGNDAEDDFLLQSLAAVE